MGSDQDLLLRMNQIVAWAMGGFGLVVALAAGIHYGAKLGGSVSKSYASSKTLLSESRGQLAKVEMSSLIETKEWKPSPEMQEYFDKRNAEFEANKRIGEQYRAPSPRWP